jgi:glycosyltransferase involved in cell wall biosynthesis
MESCPYSLIEAMALGKPIVASSVPGILDMVSDGVDALLVRPGDPKALASAMQRILDDPSLGQKLGSAAAQGAQERFSLARMCQETEQYFEQVVAAS